MRIKMTGLTIVSLCMGGLAFFVSAYFYWLQGGWLRLIVMLLFGAALINLARRALKPKEDSGANGRPHGS